MLFPCVAIVTVGQFKVLGCNFKNMFYTSLLKYGVPKNDVIAYSKNFNMPENEHRFVLLVVPLLQYRFLICSNLTNDHELSLKIDNLIQTKQFQDILWDTFLSYINRHQQLMTYIDDIDDFFSYYFIVKLPMHMLYTFIILYVYILVSDTITVVVLNFS